MEGNTELEFNYETKYEKNRNLEIINVDLVNLTECNGNLRKLQSEYSANDAIKMCKNCKGSSKGKMAEKALVETPSAFSALAKELSDFLEKSCVFFENVGVSFEEMDSGVAMDLKR